MQVRPMLGRVEKPKIYATARVVATRSGGESRFWRGVCGEVGMPCQSDNHLDHTRISFMSNSCFTAGVAVAPAAFTPVSTCTKEARPLQRACGLRGGAAAAGGGGFGGLELAGAGFCLSLPVCQCQSLWLRFRGRVAGPSLNLFLGTGQGRCKARQDADFAFHISSGLSSIQISGHGPAKGHAI